VNACSGVKNYAEVSVSDTIHCIAFSEGVWMRKDLSSVDMLQETAILLIG
jgi:hypothetical protein